MGQGRPSCDCSRNCSPQWRGRVVVTNHPCVSACHKQKIICSSQTRVTPRAVKSKDSKDGKHSWTYIFNGQTNRGYCMAKTTNTYKYTVASFPDFCPDIVLQLWRFFSLAIEIFLLEDKIWAEAWYIAQPYWECVTHTLNNTQPSKLRETWCTDFFMDSPDLNVVVPAIGTQAHLRPTTPDVLIHATKLSIQLPLCIPTRSYQECVQREEEKSYNRPCGKPNQSCKNNNTTVRIILTA